MEFSEDMMRAAVRVAYVSGFNACVRQVEDEVGGLAETVNAPGLRRKLGNMRKRDGATTRYVGGMGEPITMRTPTNVVLHGVVLGPGASDAEHVSGDVEPEKAATYERVRSIEALVVGALQGDHGWSL